MRIFIDMDGVLANFWDGLLAAHATDDPYATPANLGVDADENVLGLTKDQFWAPCSIEFWANLAPLPNCYKVIEMAEKLVDHEDICILTSPHLGKPYGCFDGKMEWLDKHLPGYSRRALIGKPKRMCANYASVLIDDNAKNCAKFEEAGGDSILYPSPWNKNHDRDQLEYLKFRLDSKTR